MSVASLVTDTTEFDQLGIECLVVNPADIPCTHKDEVYKTDGRDARG
ncbi:MAG: hypothetical protein IPQ25_18995 [Chitinophagaceae bacterium]|nr:hypothetical protein [Chitinophagaceae bacterium]